MTKLTDILDEKSKGLWANIHAKRKRGGKPAKKGSKQYRKTAAAVRKLQKEAERVARKKGQKKGSKKHSDLYTDEDPKGTIKGLGFKDAATAKKGVAKINSVKRTHAHKVQATLVMQQRAKVAKQRAKDPEKKKDLGQAYQIWSKKLAQLKKKTKSMKEVDYHSKNSRMHKPDWYKLHGDDKLDEDSGFSMKQFCKSLTEGKKLTVFDFDDTLAKSDSWVYVTQNGKTVQKLDPGEFAVHKLKKGQEYNFSDFDKMLRNPKLIKKNAIEFKKQADHARRTSGHQITILTARGIGYPVKTFFKKMGLDVYVVPLKSADPKKKAEYIENKIKSGYTDVYFIDDSSKNVRAVQALQVKYPNVKIKTVKA